MSERTYYVLCEDNCKFESMTKEQILSAITQAVESHEISDVDTGFVTTLKEANKNGALSFWVGTQAEYNAIATKANNRFYIITDDDEEAELNATLTQMQAQITVLTTEAAKKGVVLYDGENIPYGENLSVLVEGLSGYTLVKVSMQASDVLCYIKRNGDNFSIFGVGTGGLNSTTNTYWTNVNITGSVNTITTNHSTIVELNGGVLSTPSQAVIMEIVGIM